MARADKSMVATRTGGRWGPVLAVVALVVLGAMATVINWLVHTSRTSPPRSTTTAHALSDFVTTDDSVLLVWPRNTKPLHVTVGQHLEIILETESLQLVYPRDTSKLLKVSPFPCHVASLCGAIGVTTWSFDVVRPGATVLHIIYGTGCPPQSCLTGTIDKPVIIAAAATPGVR